MSKKKEFTHDDLKKAIDLALDNGKEAKGRYIGMRDLSTDLFRLINEIIGSKNYTSNSERLAFMELYLRSLSNHYTLKVRQIEEYESLGMTEALLDEIGTDDKD